MEENNLMPVPIAPESLEVANAYLQYNDIRTVAKELSLPGDVVSSILERREVQKYIDSVFMDIGYRNRQTLGDTLDAIIAAKLEEMQEAEITSSKDITDILALAHKMRMDELDRQLKLMKLEIDSKKAVSPSGTVVNIQDNSIEGSNYGGLMSKLLGNK